MLIELFPVRQTLRFELETFVCKGEYQRGLVKIMESFLGNLGQPEQLTERHRTVQS